MRELRTCDFCAGDAAGTFEIVPPELEPTEAEQRRVVCCSACRDRLEVLLEPLLARAGVGSAGATASAGTDDRDGGREERLTTADETDEADDASGAVVASANDSTQKQSRTSSPNATVSDGDSDTDSRIGSVLEDGITFERSEAAASDPDGEETDADGANETTIEDTTVEAAAENGANESGAAEDSSDAAVDDPTDDDVTSRPPAGYGKVIRLLQNREFPIQRNAVENLAAGAYDLETHEISAIVDHALEEGEFTENRDMLERPDN
ncbi:hypothetical protein [Natronorubrum halophilum]|uniref:hypothetical protein n=1 Tax=Natronorubrum halophilum TaxID=1702106 RepID=UPI000EF64EE2|nr:hypothetical protein [Natronorubrum halophilum]